jgi:hyperosmotically inducible protein
MRKTLWATMVVLATLGACKSHSNDAAPADNTAQNKRDHDTTPTADNAGQSATDRDLTQQIRKAVMDDGALSTNAHNCKIVVQNGMVTLVGPVASDDERTRVADIATKIVGAGKVTNQLEVTK